ncbi:MAG: heavy-metal-associated domain-containing protein [Flavobacterium sp.]
MKFSKLILVFSILILFFVACKKNGNTSIEKRASAHKEVAAAVKPETATFHIEGMTCPEGCAKTIEKKLSEMEGVQNAKVDFDKKEATVNFDLDKLNAADLVKAVETTGDGKTYKVSVVKTGNKV